MNIRPLADSDFEALLALDASFVTDRVWQMRQQGGTQQREIVFQLVSLPRPLRVSGLYDAAMRRACLRYCSFGWVAEEEGVVRGCLTLEVFPWLQTAWITWLVVAPEVRRRGIGSALLDVAIAQARALNLLSVQLHLSTKNYPATRFCNVRGLQYCGYLEASYGNEIMLLFAYRIR
ncbi:MAG: GNAT family N-acetyltransferase [Thermoflexales bacterium]|nr:GNAT family N-acetyltransferase [Thermoflexales bacterium]MCX7939698.1 GNAT family N-acetyltransferase [Thermoflexales bacterium]MDW8053526.1 GNAT family N-acetyltransferase [Anaerolineae bacterium]MDW8292178.1 GNAT family N-acetyltransferase [Anaerolineae bacterium]